MSRAQKLKHVRKEHKMFFKDVCSLDPNMTDEQRKDLMEQFEKLNFKQQQRAIQEIITKLQGGKSNASSKAGSPVIAETAGSQHETP